MIEVKNLTFSYNGKDKAVNKVSFNVRDHEWLSILGHNGSGKSTIAKLLIGLLEPKSGEILYDGVKLSIDTVISAYKKEDKDSSILEKASKGIVNKTDSNSLISIAGTSDIKVNLASCCKPVPGDRIVGYITKGYGVTVHRMVCPNVAEIDERLINVQWNEFSEKLPTSILVRVNSSKNMLIDVVSKATNQDIPVKRFSTTRSKDEDLIKMTVLVNDKEKLLKLMNDIKMVEGVIEVSRLIN